MSQTLAVGGQIAEVPLEIISREWRCFVSGKDRVGGGIGNKYQATVGPPGLDQVLPSDVATEGHVGLLCHDAHDGRHRLARGPY